jgi:lipopolysaccharide export LptBFGC system permease protein LptF
MKKFLIVSLLASASVLALAKLPAPAADDAAKAKADEAKAKAAWTGKVGAYKLCKAQDAVAAVYFKSAKAAGKETRPATATPACADPGAFVYKPS